jgi:hypothetical protein
MAIHHFFRKLNYCPYIYGYEALFYKPEGCGFDAQ